MQQFEDIAIIGVGCKFPGARNLNEYWRVLSKGENHVKEVPRDRWNLDAYYDPDPNVPGKMYVRTAGFVDGIDEWDHRFYGINDLEAELVDPQQRMVLDCVHMAFEDAGIRRKDVEGSNTSVYIGCMTDDYKGHVLDDATVSSTYSVTGTHNSIISARVSYVYNLTGTAMTIDTACSSSLVAIKIGSEALVLGTSDMVICGGVNVLLDPQLFIALSKARMLSPDGQCKTFTSEANGYARGEGCGIVILKRLSKALEDGNKIWSTIKAGSNQDGRTATPITAPSGLQQERLINTMFTNNGTSKSTVSLIEAHGTGTPIGDPTEVSALGNHFGAAAGINGVYIGSVKTNIGHLEAASGVAGLIKVLLMMKHDTVVPSLFYTKENENSKLKLSERGFIVPTACTAWTKKEGVARVACINSFGFGGTNAHAIVMEFINSHDAQHEKNDSIPYFIALSALDNPSLRYNIKHLAESLRLSKVNLASLSCTSTCKRDLHPYREIFPVQTQNELLTKCDQFMAGKENASASTDKKNIVFVFCGVGTTWRGMCKNLLGVEIFRNTIKEIDIHLKPLAGWSIEDTFSSSRDFSLNPVVSHIAIFSCQVGIANLWNELGVEPDAVVGQSVGEVAAAHIAGFIDLKVAVFLIFHRSLILASVKTGSMAVVRNIPTEIVRKVCESNKEAACIAVVNSPVSCTISGAKEAIKNIIARLESLPEVTPTITKLDVACAYHSPLVINAARQFKDKLGHIQKGQGHIPFCSSVTGKMETNGILSTADYWEKNVKNTVLFSDAVINSTTTERHNVFLEIGPHPVLRAHVKNIVTENIKYTVVPSMKKEDDMHTFVDAVCTLFKIGVDINWDKLVPCKSFKGQPTGLPSYQQRRQPNLYRSDYALSKVHKLDTSSTSHPYIKRVPAIQDNVQFKMEVDRDTTWFVYQHEVNGAIILPGACYADVGFEISKPTKTPKNQTLVSVEFLRPVKVDDGRKTILNVSTIESEEQTVFYVKHHNAVTCKGWVKNVPFDLVRKERIDVDRLKISISSSTTETYEKDVIYQKLRSLGFKHGPCFRMMMNAITNGNESLSEVCVPDNILRESESVTLHPCVLDIMMQSTINTTGRELMKTIKQEDLRFLPVAIDEIYCYRQPEENMILYTKRTNTTILETVFQAHYNVLLMTSDGLPVAEIVNYCTFSHRNGQTAPCELRYELNWNRLSAYSKDSNLPCPKVLLLSNTDHQKSTKSFDQYTNVAVAIRRTDVHTHRIYVEDSFALAKQRWGSTNDTDAVVLLIQEKHVESVSTKEEAFDLFQLVKENCFLLAELVKYKTENSILTPLYVVTQNTQPTTSVSNTRHSMVGAEIWGFIRSLHMEIIHGDITMVDLQPSLEEAKHSLIKFIAESLNQLPTTASDIIIHNGKILGGQIEKVKRTQLTPSLRQETVPVRTSSSQYDVCAKQSSGKGEKYLRIPDHVNCGYEKSTYAVRVCEVVIHPADIFPKTVSELKSEQDIWKDSLNDGHTLMGIEFTGHISSSGKSRGLVCRPDISKDRSDKVKDLRKVVAFYPTQMKTEVKVPKECIVDLKELPFYKPGLVTHAMLFWKLVDQVEPRKTVLIHKGRANALPYPLLEVMLKSLKSSEIIDPQETDKNVDYVLTLTKIDESFDLLWKCDTVVCLQNNFQESVESALARANKHTVIKIKPKELFDKKYISKTLPKLVSWMQRRSKLIETSIESVSPNLSLKSFDSSEYESFPSEVIQIYKDGCFNIPLRKSLSCLFSRQCSYIVTGGATGLGWETVKLLAEMGAGVVAPMSRRAVSREKVEEANTLSKSTGCSIIFLQCDTNEYSSIVVALNTLRVNFPRFPLKGVFHCAGVLQDKLLMKMDNTDLENVLKPKVLGLLNMHVATLQYDLDYFVVSSSLSCMIGSPGQGNYGAANSFQDACIEWRRRAGLPGQAINWGALSIGMAAMPAFVENLTKRGFSLMSIPELRSCYQEILLRNRTGVIYSEINWNIVTKDYKSPQMARPRIRIGQLLGELVSNVTSNDNEDDGADFIFDVHSLKKSDSKTQKSALMQLATIIAGKVVGGPVGQIKDSSTLSEMSFDSMSTVTFTNVMQERTGYRIPPSFMADSSRTLTDIVILLYEKVFVGSIKKLKKRLSESENVGLSLKQM